MHGMFAPAALRRRLLLLGLTTIAWRPARAVVADRVRIGQATTSLSFLPLWAGRATGAFAAQSLSLEWAAIPGGDPTALAALDAGDIDLAAVGSDTALTAIAKGQPFLMVYDLMSKVSLELVVSPALMTRTGVTPDDALPKRLAAMKGAVIGVSAVGGAQDRMARWLARQGGLGPDDIQVALVGGPPAIQAALENKRIDAFILSPPEGAIAEAAGSGRILIRAGDAFPALRTTPFLVLVARREAAAKSPDLIRRSAQALQAASGAVARDPTGTADAIQRQFFPKLPAAIIEQAVRSLSDGVTGRGAFDESGIQALIHFSAELGDASVAKLNPGGGDNAFWTNRFAG